MALDLKKILEEQIKKRRRSLLLKIGGDLYSAFKPENLATGVRDVAKKFIAGGLFEGGIFSNKTPKTFGEAFKTGVQKRGEVIARNAQITPDNPIPFLDVGVIGSVSNKVGSKVKNIIGAVDDPTKRKMMDIIDYIRGEQPPSKEIENEIFNLQKKFNIPSNVSSNKLADTFQDLIEKTKTAGGEREVIKGGQESKSLSKTLQTKIPQKGGMPQLPSQVPQDVSSFYNVDRLNIDNKAKTAIKNEIEKAGDYLNKTVGTKLTNKEVLDLASSTQRMVNRNVTRETTRAKIASNLRLRQQIAKTAQDGKIDEDFIKLWVKDKSIGEDIARQLQARRIQADPHETGFIDTILQSIYKVNQNADEIAKAAQDVDFNDVKQVTEFYRKFVKPKTSEWIDLLRYNSMLTSPNTHMVNIMSNFQGTGLITPVEKTLTGLIDATKSALTGQPRKYAVGEGASYAKGYFENLGKASKRFMDVMRGTDVVSHPDIRQIPLATKGPKKVVEQTLNLPMRLLDAMDKFFMTATEGGIERSRALRKVKGITFEGESVTKEATRRVFRAGSENQGQVLNAIDGFTNLLMSARNHENSVLSTMAKFTLPFVRTPTELLKQGIEYSPAGLATLPGAKNKTEQVSKMLIGTGTAMGVATLLGEDRLTWAEPTNAKQKAEFKASGRQPYSVKVGDKWISYSKLHPAMAFNFALVAALDDAKKQRGLSEDDADSVLQAFAKYGNFLADQSYLKNIGDFVANVKGDVEAKTKLAGNYIQQLVPFRALLSWVERLTDPYQRQVDPNGNALEKQMQYFIMQIPGWAQTLPTRKSQFMTPIENQNRVLNAFSPNRVTTEVPAFEGLYQVGETKRKITGYKQDIKDMIKKEIDRRLLEATN